jgi:hypothetical protein
MVMLSPYLLGIDLSALCKIRGHALPALPLARPTHPTKTTDCEQLLFVAINLNKKSLGTSPKLSCGHYSKIVMFFT